MQTCIWLIKKCAVNIWFWYHHTGIDLTQIWEWIWGPLSQQVTKDSYLKKLTPFCLTINMYTKGLWKRITIFLHVSCKPYMWLKKVLAGTNVQPRIGMNQSSIWLHYSTTLLMTSHGYIQHPKPFCKVSWNFLIIFVFKLWCVQYHNQQRNS